MLTREVEKPWRVVQSRIPQTVSEMSPESEISETVFRKSSLVDRPDRRDTNSQDCPPKTRGRIDPLGQRTGASTIWRRILREPDLSARTPQYAAQSANSGRYDGIYRTVDRPPRDLEITVPYSVRPYQA